MVAWDGTTLLTTERLTLRTFRTAKGDLVRID